MSIRDRKVSQGQPEESWEYDGSVIVNSLPWFTFHPMEFLTITTGMTSEEKGIAITLMCHQWFNGVLPSDENQLSFLAGAASNWSEVRNNILRIFPIQSNGRRFNTRFDAIRKESILKNQKQRKNGRYGAQKRWQQHRGAKAPLSESDAHKHSHQHLHRHEHGDEDKE